MPWPFSRRKPARLSEVIEGALGALLRETTSRFVEVYWPILGDDLGEVFAQNWGSFVLVLSRHEFQKQWLAGCFKGDPLLQSQVGEVWDRSVSEVLQRRARSSAAYEESLEKYTDAIAYYEQQTEALWLGGLTASPQFLHVRVFADKIADISSPQRRQVMAIAAAIADSVVEVWKCAPRMCRIAGP